MPKTLSIILGSGWSIALLVLGLWTWQRTPILADYMNAGRPHLMFFAVRSTAVSLLAAGESIVILFVIGNVWNRDRLTSAIGLSAVALFILGAAGGLILGAAGR